MTGCPLSVVRFTLELAAALDSPPRTDDRTRTPHRPSPVAGLLLEIRNPKFSSLCLLPGRLSVACLCEARRQVGCPFYIGAAFCLLPPACWFFLVPPAPLLAVSPFPLVTPSPCLLVRFFPIYDRSFPLTPSPNLIEVTRIGLAVFGQPSAVALHKDRSPARHSPGEREWTRLADPAAPFGPSRSCVLETPLRCVPLCWPAASHPPLPVF